LAAGRQDGSAAHLNLPLSRLAETESDNVTRSLELETSADAEVFPFSFVENRTLYAEICL